MEHSIPSRLLTRPVSVTVVGAGGTGSQVVKHLAALHTAMVALGHPHGLNVTLADDDIVTEANVARQAFFASDVGQPKAAILVNRINMAFGLNWDAEVRRLGEGEDGVIRNADIVVGCVDNRLARKAILEAGRPLAYWLDFGNRLNDGQVVLGQFTTNATRRSPDERNRLPNVADLFPESVDEQKDQEEDDIPSCSLADALDKQSLLINPTLAAVGVNILWKLFRFGKITNHGAFVNLETDRVTPLAIDPVVWKRMGFPPKVSK